MVASPPCRRSLLRLFRAALVLARSSLHSACTCPSAFFASFSSFAEYYKWALRRQGQALRVAAQALTPAHLQWRHCERRKQRKNRRGPAAEAAERPRRACQAQGNLDYPPVRAFAVTNAGRKSQGKNSLRWKNKSRWGGGRSRAAWFVNRPRQWGLTL
jgi:hypothetical protein